MYRPVLEYSSFESISLDEKLKVLEIQLEALVAANVFWLPRHPEAPDLYKSGAVYVPEPPGEDHWQDIPRCLELVGGYGSDCEDLSAWRVAELRVRYNEPAARCDVMARKLGRFTLFHIRVRRQDGSLEDPSKILGMK